MGNETKHTPGPWEHSDKAIVYQQSDLDNKKMIAYCCYVDSKCDASNQELQANARLIAAAPDRSDQVIALSLLDWSVSKRSLYDEEGIEGWAWIEPDGTEHVEVGDWDELPPWPASAREAIAKATPA